MNDAILMDGLTDRQKEVIELYQQEYDVQPKGAVSRTAKKLGVKSPYVSECLKELRNLQEKQKLEMIKHFDDFEHCLSDLTKQMDRREEWIQRLEENLDKLEARNERFDKSMEDLEIQIDGIWIDEEKHKADYQNLQNIRKILISHNSPRHQTANFQEVRKTIDTMNRVMDSHNSAVRQLMIAQKYLLSINPDELPRERQEELVRWYIKRCCIHCAGNPFREQELRERMKDFEESIDVKYGEVK